MDNDSKLTYIIIVALILVLGTAAYFLRGGYTKTEPLSIVTETATSTKTLSTNKSASNKTTNLKNVVIIATSTGTNMNIPQNIKGAIIKTNMGEIDFDFATTAPNTVANFVSLVSTKFYDGVRFHRVIKDFMIQTGDPLSKDILQKAIWGTGGPGYKFADELSGKEKYTQGTVAMANAGPNTNGSQFFIVTASPEVPLPPSYTVFGHLTAGMDVAMKIQDVKTDASDKPIEDVIIESVTLR